MKYCWLKLLNNNCAHYRLASHGVWNPFTCLVYFGPEKHGFLQKRWVCFDKRCNTGDYARPASARDMVDEKWLPDRIRSEVRCCMLDFYCEFWTVLVSLVEKNEKIIRCNAIGRLWISWGRFVELTADWTAGRTDVAFVHRGLIEICGFVEREVTWHTLLKVPRLLCL